METIYIDPSRYSTAGELHQALKMLLNLPDYYGGNADALHDCLGERREPVNLFLAGEGAGEVAEALRKVRMVVEDLGGRVDS